jgi:hypothetical protein
VTADLYDAVTCTTAGCTPDRPAEPLVATAFTSRSMSRFGADGGTYVYVEATRPGGAVAVLELDVPVAATGEPVLSYREFVRGVPVFESTAVTGRIVVPSAVDCACQDGLFALRFVATAPDGTEQVRWLDRGHFGPRGAPCRARESLAIPKRLDVVPVCDDAGAVVDTGDSGDLVLDVDVDVNLDTSDGGNGDATAASGCSSGDDTSDDGSGGGCGGDDSSNDGCQGNSGDSQGCGGGDSSGCQSAGSDGGDCRIARRPGHHGHPADRALGLLVPLFCVGLIARLGRRRRR